MYVLQQRLQTDDLSGCHYVLDLLFVVAPKKVGWFNLLGRADNNWWVLLWV